MEPQNGFIAASTIVPDFDLDDLLSVQDDTTDFNACLHILTASLMSGTELPQNFAGRFRCRALALIVSLQHVTGQQTTDPDEGSDTFALPPF